MFFRAQDEGEEALAKSHREITQQTLYARNNVVSSEKTEIVKAFLKCPLVSSD